MPADSVDSIGELKTNAGREPGAILMPISGLLLAIAGISWTLFPPTLWAVAMAIWILVVTDIVLKSLLRQM